MDYRAQMVSALGNYGDKEEEDGDPVSGFLRGQGLEKVTLF